MTLSTLEKWFGDKETVSRHWTRSPVVCVGTAESPFGTGDLDAAIDSGALRVPYLEMARADRREVPVEEYTSARTVRGEAVDGVVDPVGLRACLAAGATLLMRNVEHWHRPSRALCETVGVETGRPVEAFVFVTPPRAQGLATHRDNADVVVLQVAGTKIWNVGDGPSSDRWRSGELERGEKSHTTLQTTLSPGDLLHIPRGFAHHAIGADSVSVHLSITVRDTCTADLRKALESELARGLDLPALPIGNAAIRDVAEQVLDHYRRRIAEIDVVDLLEPWTRPHTEPRAPFFDRLTGQVVASARAPKRPWLPGLGGSFGRMTR